MKPWPKTRADDSAYGRKSRTDKMMIDNETPTASEARLVDPDGLRTFTAAVYESAGVGPDDARLMADTLVQADMWGHQSHGMLRLGWYYARLRSGAMKPTANARIVVDGGAIAVMDGEDGPGQVVARRAVDEAVARARQHGVGVVSIRNSNHF